jgi:hypothetical protein
MRLLLVILPYKSCAFSSFFARRGAFDADRISGWKGDCDWLKVRKQQHLIPF